MPCDSAAAGLVTLGAMISDLGDPLANAHDGHYDGLLRYARIFLEGKTPGVSGRLRLTTRPHTTYQISSATDFKAKKLVLKCRDGVIWTISQPALDFYVDGEPPPQWKTDAGLLGEDPYRRILPEADIVSQNLGRSYAGLCLAGRVAGEQASRKICSDIRFLSDTRVYGLDELLSIHGWSSSMISRVSFFNCRTKQLDRCSALPSLVVADGDQPFLHAIHKTEWKQTDIIGVIHRTMERDRLEAIGAEVIPNQWYTDDFEMLCEVPPVVRGISISIRRRRS